MKKLVFTLGLAAFTLAIQAGTQKPATTEKTPSCCSGDSMSADAKAQCPMMKQAKATCPYMSKMAKDASAKPLLSPKALADARK